ncbi:MAG: hypothetical protein VYC27_04425 [Candidatus Thermoplasmatota archaeon]|nr:hypothetical protein [Candidatus Thermoplasmatota archaeon]MEC8079471.1 hypothetical protein [Candidatus Thermoplasmatota archaeon]MEC8265099.1 hypothetical protein [Candidatus Thermoplasmatota archaeon]MEC9205232.1 hypothetical protein [Candidatus Thermoplasmatota archaeon]MED5499172.1 hypothetical protein [Candidatus Thermoplasmatota archaeon]
MSMTRREAAERWKSAVEAEAKLRSRTSLGIAIIVIISGLIGSIELRYGIGAVLLLGVLFQFSLERMRETFRVAAESSRQRLGWKDEEISTEELLARLTTFLDQR